MSLPAVVSVGFTASRSPERHQSAKVQWIIMKDLVVVQNQTGIPVIGTHAGTPSHWLIGTEFDSVNATHMLPPPNSPLTCSFSPFHKTARTPSTPHPPSLCTCCCEQQDPSVCFCSSLAFLPALTTPSLHPFLSCVLCCQAQLDQACQSSHMQSLLLWKQVALMVNQQNLYLLRGLLCLCKTLAFILKLC